MKGLAAGTVVALLVTTAWSAATAVTMGPPAPVHLSVRHPLASYMALAAAPTGNGPELFAAIAVIYAVCLFLAARRREA